MIILVSGATKTVGRYPQLGRLVSPSVGNSLEEVAASGRPWAADNEAFVGWDIDRYWRMLGRLSRVDRSRLLWVVCPDVVGDAQETANRWLEWYPQLAWLDLPAAFVGQDGLEAIPDEIPWDEMRCFFLGGSTGWKLGEAAERFAREARERGKWVHMGRVNTEKRIRHAIEIGCDSIDGKSFSAWPDIYIPRGLRWIRKHESQASFLVNR
jgi:hypothetical protein